MALPVWRSKGTDAHTATPTTGCTPGLPTGWAQDDVFVATVTTGDNGTLNTPAGWVLKHTQSQAASQLYIFWRLATASESAPTFDAANNTPDYILAVISAYSGCETSGDPFHQITGANATSSTSVSFPSVTTTTADCLICNAISVGTDSTSSTLISGWTNAALSSITERYDQATDDGGGGGLAFATAGLATAGAVGNTTATLATASGQAKVTFALMPPQLRTGDLSKTLAAATISAAGAAAIVGTLSKTLAVLAISAAGTHPVTGDFSKSLGAVVSSAAGGVATGGALSGTLGALTIASAGTADPFLNLNVTLGAVTLSSGGAVAIAGAGAITLGAVTSSAAGGVAVAGSLSKTLGGLTITASGLRELRGVLTVTMASITPAIAGSFPVTADLSKTLGAASISSAANVLVGGALTRTLGALTGGGAGVVATGGVVNATLGSLTPSVAGVVATGGVVNKTLAGLGLSGVGVVANGGALNSTLAALTLAADGAHPVVGGVRGRNMVPYTENDPGWIARGTTPPVADGTAVEDGLKCVATTFDASNAVGFTASRADASQAGSSFGNVVGGGPYTFRGLVKVSRALLPGEQVLIYVTGSNGLGAKAIQSSFCPTTFTEFVVTTPAYTPLGTNLTEYFTCYLGGAVALPVTVWIAERSFEYGSTFNGYQRNDGASGEYLGPITLSGAGAVDQQGALSVTLGGLGLAATGSGFPLILGDLSQTLGGLLVSAAGVNATGGILTTTLAPVAIASAGSNPIVGVLTKTMAAVTISAAGGAAVAGALSKTLDPMTVVAAGTHPVTANLRGANLVASPLNFLDTAAWTPSGLIPVGVTAPDGTSAWSLTDDSAVAYESVGAAQIRIPRDTGPVTFQFKVRKTVGAPNTVGANISLSGGTTVPGNMRVNPNTGNVGGVDGVIDAGDYWLIYRTLTNNGTNGFANLTLYPATGTNVGANTGADNVSGQGTAEFWQPMISIGSGVATFDAGYPLGAAILSAAGSVSDAATLAATLGPLTLSGAGAVAIAGALTRTLGPLAVVAAGGVAVLANLARTLGPASITAAGAVVAGGTLAKTLGALTMVGAATHPVTGNVEGNNWLTWSEAFNQWTAVNMTVDPNVAQAPNGTWTADKLIVANGIGTGSAQVQVTVSKPARPMRVTYSGFASPAGFNTAYVMFNDGSNPANQAYASVRVTDGVVLAAALGGTFTNLDSGSELQPDGSYRVWVTATTGSETSLRAYIFSRLDGGGTGNGVDGIYVWGAMMNEGDDPLPYQGVFGVRAALLGGLGITTAGGVAIAANLNRTFGALVLAGAGGVAVVGALTVALQPATILAVGAVPVVGNLDRLLGAISGQSAGQVDTHGNLTQTFGPMSGAATGKVWPFRRFFFSLN